MKKIEFKLKSEPEIKDKKYIDIFKDNFTKFIDKSEGKLNQYVKKDNVEINDIKLHNLLVDTLNNIVIVGLYIDWNHFFTQFEKWDLYQNMNQFLIWMQQYIKDRNFSYEETDFVRSMNYDALKDIIDHCFYNYILEYNAMEEKYLDLNQNQIITIVKILRTLIVLIIENNYSYKTSFDTSYEMFIWDESVFKLFWEIINNHQDVLWRITIMQKLNSLEEELAYIRKTR